MLDLQHTCKNNCLVIQSLQILKKKIERERERERESLILNLRDNVCIELESETEGLAINSNGRETEKAINLTLYRNVSGIWQSNRQVNFIRTLCPKNLWLSASANAKFSRA